MTTKKSNRSPCSPSAKGFSCCRVESVTSVDERGQMVLPKEVRKKANIQAGDKLAVITWEKEEQVCCITLIKAADFQGMVREFLGPMMKDLVS